VSLDQPAIPFAVALQHPTSAPAQFHALAYALSNGDDASVARFRGRLARLGWTVARADGDGRSP
jgi:hypothetical protein